MWGIEKFTLDRGMPVCIGGVVLSCKLLELTIVSGHKLIVKCL
jgi:hypothetical protein